MDRKILVFIALAISMLYGAGFSVVDEPSGGYAQIGAVVVALGWIGVGVFGRDRSS